MKRPLSVILVIVAFVSITAQAKYSGGSGEPNAPYQIANVADLLALAEDTNDYNKCFIMTADIDLDPNLPGGKIFTSAVIAKWWWDDVKKDFVIDKFSGTFDGAGYKINNMYIDNNVDTTVNYLGLFGYIDKGEIKNLELSNAFIAGSHNTEYIGGLAGYVSDANINDCFLTATISGDFSYNIGGLIGCSSRSNIKDCNTSVNIIISEAISFNIGGLLGSSYNDDINNCHTLGAVSGSYRFGFGTSELGGIAGFCENGIIRNSSSSCTVFGRGGIGGLIGTNSGTITNCSAYGYVRGDDCIGGFVGSNSGNITDCLALGEVHIIGDSSVGVGGFAGYNSNIIKNCYATGRVRSLGQYSGYTGGLVGENDQGSISSCFSTGDVWGESEVGGLVGSNSGTICNCYSAGNVIASYWHGGLAGNNTGSIINCYSIAVVKVWEDQYEELSDYAGGLVALNYGSIENSYFLSGSGRHNDIGKPLTNRQMKKQKYFKKWDFVGETANGTDDIWIMFEDVDYPKLAWCFDGNYPIAVTKCTVKDKYKGDSISVSGLISATDYDFDNADEIVVTFSAALHGILIPVHTQHFPINEDTYNDGLYSGVHYICVFFPLEGLKSADKTAKYVATNPKSHFDYNVKTHKFKITVKNADLTGLCSPFSISIQIGSFSVETEIDETIINGKKPIPINLLMGVKNSLRVDKTKFTRDRKTGNITRIAVRGGFSVEKIDDANLVINPIDITVGSQTFTIPADNFKFSKGKFTCSKVLLSPGGEIASAAFDFNKCKFSLIIKGTKIPDAAGNADFKLEFGSFIEGANVLLP